MKITLGLLLRQLRNIEIIKNNIELDSTEADGLRFVDDESQIVPSARYIFVVRKEDSVLLSCGNESVELRIKNSNSFYNDLMDVFQFYSLWEGKLRKAAADRDQQSILDYTNEVIENPLLFIGPDFKVIGKTKRYAEDEISAFWTMAQNNKTLSSDAMLNQFSNPEGEKSELGVEPVILEDEEGSRTLGLKLQAQGQDLGYLFLWEYESRFDVSDGYLLSFIGEILKSTFQLVAKDENTEMSDSVLFRILSGIQVDKKEYEQIEKEMDSSFSLFVIRFDGSSYGQKTAALKVMKELEFPLLATEFQKDYVVLIPSSEAKIFVKSLEAYKDSFLALESLSFKTLVDVSLRYGEALGILEKESGNDGFLKEEQYVFPLMMNAIARDNRKKHYLHPVLSLLKDYDKKNGSEYYLTLFEFLKHERAVLATAKALDIHKNTMLYRIQRLEEITGLDFEDASVRTYVLLSFFLENGILVE